MINSLQRTHTTYSSVDVFPSLLSPLLIFINQPAQWLLRATTTSTSNNATMYLLRKCGAGWDTEITTSGHGAKACNVFISSFHCLMILKSDSLICRHLLILPPPPLFLHGVNEAAVPNLCLPSRIDAACSDSHSLRNSPKRRSTARLHLYQVIHVAALGS